MPVPTFTASIFAPGMAAFDASLTLPVSDP
jgi:hypothetical protein